MGQPEDLMGAVTFLSSDASAYVTGELAILLCHETYYVGNTDFFVGADLRVDGGYTIT